MVKITDDISDESLIELHKNGDQKAFGLLYERYFQLVFGSCLKYFKHKEQAEDAASDIMNKVSKKLHSHQVDYFKSWLYTLTRNHCIEILRKENRHRDKINQGNLVYTEQVFHPDEVEDTEMIHKLHGCIEGLPKEQKQVIESFYFKKVSYKKIAVQYSITWDKVRSLIQNGRRNLKNCLDK